MENWEKNRKTRNEIECVNKVRNATHAHYVELANQLKSENVSNKERLECFLKKIVV